MLLLCKINFLAIVEQHLNAILQLNKSKVPCMYIYICSVFRKIHII